jgi:hypothetical protein
VWEALGVDGVSYGAVSVEVDGAIPWPDDDAGGLLRDWVMHDVGIGAPGSTVSGDATRAPGTSGVAGLGVMRVGTMGTMSPRLSRKEQGAYHESAHLA